MKENTPAKSPSPGKFNVPGIPSGILPGAAPTIQEFPWPGGLQPPRPEYPAGWQETKDFGSAFGNIEYRDFKLDGSYLIGFELGLGKFVRDNDILTYIRPIWQTPSGEQFGTGYGRRPVAVWTMKAKEGYALAGATVVAGLALDGIGLTFMKKNGPRTLDPNDWYLSDWYGQQNKRPGQEKLRVGDGSLLVGIHGMRFEDKGGTRYNDGGSISSIGFVLLPKTEPKVEPKKEP